MSKVKILVIATIAAASIGISCSKDSPAESRAATPKVVTASVNTISQTTAECGGTVIDNGGASISARGICWNTSGSPTLDDATTIDGTGDGSFTSSLTNLTVNTRFYVRAYATNSVGTTYGAEESFQSLVASLPVLTTSPITAIAQTTAQCGGTIISDGGTNITFAGVCWDTNPNPTIDDRKTIDGISSNSFVSEIYDLTPKVTYYVRAYATNSVGTNYGGVQTFTSSSLPTSPQGVHSITGNQAVYLYWNGVYDNNVRQYIVWRSNEAVANYVEVGRVDAVDNPNSVLLIYEFIDINLTNGVTYYYAVSSLNADGLQSDLSDELVFDTPRNEGMIVLFPNNISPQLAGFDFETGVAVSDTSSLADVFVDMTSTVYYLNVTDSLTDIMDMGYTAAFDDISYSPSTDVNVGWIELPWVELVIGHTYIIWTRDNHFAKLRPVRVNLSGSVVFQWAWQNDAGNPELIREQRNSIRTKIDSD